MVCKCMYIISVRGSKDGHRPFLLANRAHSRERSEKEHFSLPSFSSVIEGRRRKIKSNGSKKNAEAKNVIRAS